MPGKSSKTRTRSVRIPLELLEELEATARKRERTVNEEIVSRIASGADPDWSPEAPKGQMEMAI